MTGRWPNLFLVGAEKAGTTSLYNYLDQHPETFMSPEKEPHLFTHRWDNADGDERALSRAKADYRTLFEDAEGYEVVGEASTSYLWHPQAADRIHATVPEARILISLRDPVGRAYSHYLMLASEGKEERSFEDAIEELLEDPPEASHSATRYVRSGRYHDQIERYLSRFGEDRVKVLLLPEWRQDPRGALREIARFLDVSADAVAEIELGRHHTYKEPRGPLAAWLRESEHVRGLARKILPRRIRDYLGNEALVEESDKPPMPEGARARLEAVFEPELDRLETLLGRDLSALRASWATTSP